MTNVPPPTSLEAKLRQQAEADLLRAEELSEDAQRRLAWVASVYSGQLTIENLEFDIIKED